MRFSQTNPTFELRDYQKRVIREIYGWYRRGQKSVMLVSPTGSGKTITAVHVIRDALIRGSRVLFIVHREPLIDQTVNTLTAYGIPSEQIGYIKAGYPHADGAEMVIVASIQTLARRDYPDSIELVIFDETHTTSFWETSRNLISYYAQAPVISLSSVKFLHLTATPWRTKTKEYFGNHVEAIVRAPDIGSLIRMGYLVSARHFGYGGLLDFSKLEIGSDGDYKQSQLNIVCADKQYNCEVVTQFQRVCRDRRALAFCAGVEQSLLLSQLFNEAGLKTEHIQAETPHEIRKEIYRRFREGKTQIISSVGTLTEGFDEPSCEAVILARPTRSLSLLIQMAGRGLRLSAGKQDCFLLDFGENFKRLGRIDQKHQITLCPRPANKPETNLKQCPNCHATINQFARICPECGFEFSSDASEPEDSFLAEFGELLDEETKKKVTYIRAQRKSRFTRKLPPDPLWDNWQERYPNDLLCNDWLYQAVFRGDTTVAAQQKFLHYLHQSRPNPRPDWLKFQMEVEFGSPEQKYCSKTKGKYSPPPLEMNLLNWWSVLRVKPLASFEEVKIAYQNLTRQAQDDSETIKLLNWALEQYKNAVGIYEWSDLIRWTDAELSRIGWTTERAREYLILTFGKRSRQLLSDEEILEFWQALKILPDKH